MEFISRNNLDSINVMDSYNNSCLLGEVPPSIIRGCSSTSDQVVTKRAQQTMHQLGIEIHTLRGSQIASGTWHLNKDNQSRNNQDWHESEKYVYSEIQRIMTELISNLRHMNYFAEGLTYPTQTLLSHLLKSMTDLKVMEIS